MAFARIPTTDRRDFQRYIYNSAQKAEAHPAASTLREIDMSSNIPDRHYHAPCKESWKLVPAREISRLKFPERNLYNLYESK